MAGLAIFRRLDIFMKLNNTTLQAALADTGESVPFCGGSVISNRHVLSAAHCTHNRNTGRVESPAALEVLVGLHDIGENPPAYQRISVTRIENHQKFDETLRNDISLLTLGTTITFSDKVSPICLPAPPPNVFSSYPDYEGQVVTTTGWGALATNGESPSVLHEVNITVTSNKDCRKAYAATHDIKS